MGILRWASSPSPLVVNEEKQALVVVISFILKKISYPDQVGCVCKVSASLTKDRNMDVDVEVCLAHV